MRLYHWAREDKVFCIQAVGDLEDSTYGQLGVHLCGMEEAHMQATDWLYTVDLPDDFDLAPYRNVIDTGCPDYVAPSEVLQEHAELTIVRQARAR